MLKPHQGIDVCYLPYVLFFPVFTGYFGCYANCAIFTDV